MSEQVIKTVENVDKLFSQIVVNGETFISDKVVEQPKPVVKPSTKTETTTTTSTTPKASRAGEDVYAVDLNDVLHNFTDRTTKQNLTEEIRNRTEKDTVMQTELNTVKSSLNTVKASVEDIQALIPNQATKDNQLADKGFVNSSISTNTANFLGTLNTVKASVEDIQALIPNQATKDNQLADKGFVNSSISTNTANFLGTFNTLEEIEALTDVTNNDYAFWKTTDTLGSVVFKRYKYIADEQLWKFEYDLNNSSFTAKQWEAINSGITAELVAKIGDGSALVPSITQEQYNNLTETEKNNGQIREITNTNPKKVMLNGMDLNEQVDILDDSKATTGNAWSATKTKAEIDARIRAEIDAIQQGGGVPVGTIHHYIGIVAPEGYLMCDKSYNATDYPQLWAVLPDSLKNFDTGTFDIDFRELVIVGAGQNAKLDIKAHDVYELGQFKDDQIQGHNHFLGDRNGARNVGLGAGTATGSNYAAASNTGTRGIPLERAIEIISDDNNGQPRVGLTTHGKQIGLNYIIKY